MIDATTPERALAIYAHPDDPEISAGGTLARWADAGAEVHVVLTTRGDKGTNDPDADIEELVNTRRGEASAAAEVLGVKGSSTLDHADGELENNRELRFELVRLLRDIR